MHKYNNGMKFTLLNVFGQQTKSGVIYCLRDDKYEKMNNHPRGIYYYHVIFDNESVETYLNESNICPI